MGIMALSFVFYLMGVAYVNLVNGIKTTTIEVHVPFCDPGSNAEFIGNNIIQVVIGVNAFLGYIGMEIFLSLFQDIVTIAPKLVRYDLNNVIQVHGNKSISETELRWRIISIAEKSIDADK